MLVVVLSPCRRSRNKKSCPFPSATQAPCSLSCCEPSGTRNSTAVRTVGSRRTVGLSALGWLVLSPCRWHYSHSKSYVPRPTPAHSSPSPRSQVPRLRSQTSPNSPHPAGPATNCQYLYLTGQRDKTDRHTQVQVTQASGQGLYLPNNHTRPTTFKPSGTTQRNIVWKRKVDAKKDRHQPVLVADPRGPVYCAALGYSFFLFSLCSGCRQGHPYIPPATGDGNLELVPEPDHSHHKSPKSRRPIRFNDGRPRVTVLRRTAHSREPEAAASCTARQSAQPYRTRNRNCNCTCNGNGYAPAAKQSCICLISHSPSSPPFPLQSYALSSPPARSHPQPNRKPNPTQPGPSNGSGSSSSLNRPERTRTDNITTCLPTNRRLIISDPVRSLWVLSCPVLSWPVLSCAGCPCLSLPALTHTHTHSHITPPPSSSLPPSYSRLWAGRLNRATLGFRPF